MAKIEIEGLDEYAKVLSALGSDADKITGKAIYEGAGMVADAVKANIDTIPIIKNNAHGSPEHPVDGVTMTQREDLKRTFGISSIAFTKGTEYQNVKLGFDGYGRTKTEKYPQGQPMQMIARSVESGTSFRKKHPFVRPIVTKMKDACIMRMSDVVDKELQERFGNKEE